MSKTKQEAIGKFELLYIISNKFSEDEVKEIKPKVNEIINKNKGKIVLSEDWGKKRLAYPIKKFTHGYYILEVFEIDRKNVANINRLMNQLREILRFSIVKYITPYQIKVGLPEKPKTATQTTTATTTQTTTTTVEVKRKDEKEKAEDLAPKKIKEEEKKENKKEEKKEEGENLDKKLDNILEAKDLF